MKTTYIILIFVIFCTISLLAFNAYKLWIKKQKIKILKIRLEAQEREKERIAKDLHDYFGARLSTLKLYMQTINKFDAERISTMTSVAMQMVDSTIVELRHLLYDLNPKKLYHGGLQNAITELSNSIQSILNIDIQVIFDFENSKLNYQTEVSIYRITQELINNTLKHAKATNIKISLIQLKKDLVLKYTDNGIGFEFEEINFGYGLNNISQHCLALEANLSMKSSINNGFDCQITIPIK